MDETTRLKYLPTALRLFAVVFVVGVPALMHLWPDAWAWTPAQPEYEQMMMGMYVVLGIFLWRAARNPLEHRSLIWFTVWSSVVHGGIMLVQALRDEADRANLIGDVPALFLVAIVLAWLMPRSGSQSR